ncbi:MAG: aminotransferase class IV [Desulfobacteraceae bacterium]|jgi:branched-chain amino acid aminotransferase
MANIYYVDGKYVPADQAVIPVDDLAIVRGIGVFDLLRTYNGKPYFLKEHVARLYHSAQEINLEMPWSQAEICSVVLETLDRNDLDEANARIIVTGGSSPDFMTPAGRPRLLVLVTPLPKLPEWWLTRGVKVITVQVKRNFPGAKSIDYLPAAVALRRAHAKDAIEAIYLDEQGHALEGTTSNVFMFMDDRLVTPGSHILSGITRKVVLSIARDHYPIEVRAVRREELLAAQEVFITGTNKGLVPVVQIDESIIGNGRPGPMTRNLMNLMEISTEGKTGK